MNKFPRITGTFLVVTAGLLLAACEDFTTPRARQFTALAPCTASGTTFETMKFDEWKDEYHKRVSEVVEAHIQSIAQTSQNPLQCTAEDYASVLRPSDKLSALASELPAWKDRTDGLSEADAGSVLLEYLRVYECSLNERRYLLSVSPLLPTERDTPMDIGDLNTEVRKEVAIIEKEVAIARPILERTLTIVGGYDRLRPLMIDIECLKRASLDLRNVLGLAAEASACMPRIWDTHGSLRDLKD